MAVQRGSADHGGSASRRYPLVLALISGTALAIVGIVFAAPALASIAAITLDMPAPGWLGLKDRYLGRYHLTYSSDHSLVNQGELVVFSRAVPRQRPVLSGVLNLYGSDESNVFYMTHFVHAGIKLMAALNLGVYTGPVVGSFDVMCYCYNTMKAVFNVQDGSKVSLRFQRYSANPHP